MASSSLPITHFSVVVRRPAVIRSYLGGAEEFDRAFPSGRANDDLSVHVSMSLSDVDFMLDRMFAGGLIPGRDIAVGYMFHGRLLGCPGVAFAREASEFDFFPAWTVRAAEDAEGGLSFWDGQVAYTPDNPFEYLWAPPGSPQESLETSGLADVEMLPKAPQVLPEEPGDGLKRPPARVTFGTGPAHWLYYDEDDE